MRTFAGLTAAAAIAMVATTSVASGQFRSGTALVLVDVVATQADGNLNRDLKREDFLIFEDGKPQEVKQFQVVDLETIAAETTDPPGVFSNRAEPGAVFALVLDDMNIDAKHTALMQQTARKFVDEQVRMGDYVGVMRTGVNSPLLLTTDRDLVRPMIAQTMGRRDLNDVASLTGGSDTLPNQSLSTAQTPDFGALGLFDMSPSARIQAEQSLVMLQKVVEYLAPIPARRKAVLLFSQGIAFDLEAFAADSNSRSFDTMRRLLAAAREGNVAVYTVDPRGLQGSQDPVTGATPVPVTRDAGIDTLRDLATATGGRAVVSTNDIPGAFSRIARENRFYYLIGYEPSDTGASKTRARQIEVKTRAPGTTLLHRKAYAPAAATAVAAVINRAPIVSPLPVSDLLISMAPVVFPDPSGGASLAVPFEIGGNLPGNDTVKYTLVAVDGRGASTTPMTGTVKVSDGSAKGMVRQRLAPGRYQLRLQAEIAGRGTGVALANVLMLEPNTESPVCGGFMLLQPDAGGTPRPNVTRFFDADRPVMAAVVLAAKSLANLTLALVVRRPGGAPEAELPLGRPQRVANGLWRVESGIPAKTFAGDAELILLANEQPIPGCRTELAFE